MIHEPHVSLTRTLSAVNWARLTSDLAAEQAGMSQVVGRWLEPMSAR